MGELRWRVRLPSWAAIVIGGVPSYLAIDALAEGGSVHPITIGVLLVGLVLLVPGLLLRLDVGADGIAIWPTGPKVPWSEVEGFEQTGLLEGTVSVYRRDRDKATHLNFQPIGRRKAGVIVARLDDELRG